MKTTRYGKRGVLMSDNIAIYQTRVKITQHGIALDALTF
jgi:hypothetical protein